MSAAPAAAGRLPAERRVRRVRRAKMTVGTALLILAAAYVLAPLYWLVIASAKNSGQLFSTPTFLPPHRLSLGANLSALFSFSGGDFKFWIINSAVYATVTAALASVRTSVIRCSSDGARAPATRSFRPIGVTCVGCGAS